MNSIDPARIAALEAHARHMRATMLRMANRSGVSAHLGGSLSVAEALAVLYGAVMNDRALPDDARDKFVLSKGHAALALYAALAEFGVIPEALLDTYMQDGSDLSAHPVMKPELGLESSSGSLGQGISLAVGLALAAKRRGYTYNTYVLCGNGEANEGSVWEACMAAVSFRLDNFTLFLDQNRMQSDGPSESVLNVSDRYADMLAALGFQVTLVDGHAVDQLCAAFLAPRAPGRPLAVVGHTVKGKGISFMENNNDWHHARLTDALLSSALAELGVDP